MLNSGPRILRTGSVLSPSPVAKIITSASILSPSSNTTPVLVRWEMLEPDLSLILPSTIISLAPISAQYGVEIVS